LKTVRIFCEIFLFGASMNSSKFTFLIY